MRSRSSPTHRTLASRALHCVVLLAPSAALALAAARLQSTYLGIAAAAALAPAIVFVNARAAWRPPVSSAVAILYIAAMAMVWLASRGTADPVLAIVRGMLLLASAALIATHDLFRTGAEPRRRARKCCAQLQARTHWPAELAEIRNLQEVYALQDAARIEPGPVFDLLRDPRAEVRMAAFAAFIGRDAWRPREASALLDIARKTPEPKVRVMAMAALSGIDDAMITRGLTDFYRDDSVEVRAAAAWATVNDGGLRWGLARDSVRAFLADPRTADAALPGVAGCLPVVAVCDLTSWSAEPEPLGPRCVRTLIDHYSYLLQTTADYDLITDLTNQVLDPATATVLRVELAALLRNLGLLTPELLDRMSNADQPGAVRLLAAEALLTADPQHPDGLDVLRGLGRQPNRDMALSIAAILQNRLGYDFGLPPEGLNPNTKAAGEVAKKVMAWAVARGGGDRQAGTPLPESGFRFGAPQSLQPATPAAASDPIAAAPLRKLSDHRPGPW